MPFFNQPSLIIQANTESLHHFTYRDNKIIHHYFDTEAGRRKKKIINHQATNDFDAGITPLGEIYLVCRNHDNGVVLLSSPRDYDYPRVIVETDKQAENLNICIVGEDLHIFYCVPQGKDKRMYNLNHYYDDGKGWTNQEMNSISKADVLNPIQSIVVGDKIILAYHNLVSGIEQIFIKIYHLKKFEWSDAHQLTTSKENKLYLDILVGELGDIELAYCEYEEGNLVVKYEKHRIEGETITKLEEKKISNPANCQNPTLIYYGQMLWLSWVEYNYIASRYSDDGGSTWSPIYLWNQSKEEDIVRHKYILDKDNRDALNYSFGSAENLSFIGFGSLDNTSVIPIKRRGFVTKMDDNRQEIINEDIEGGNETQELIGKLEGDSNKINKQIEENMAEADDHEIKNLERQIETLTKVQNRMLDNEDKKYEELKERLLIIENFLTQNTRGFRHVRKGNN